MPADAPHTHTAAAAAAPPISADAAGLPRLDKVVTFTHGGVPCTITQQELERLSMRSNSAWRLQAVRQIQALEADVAELKRVIAGLRPQWHEPGPYDSDTIQSDTS